MNTIQKISLGMAGIALWASFEVYCLNKETEHLAKSNEYYDRAAVEKEKADRCGSKAFLTIYDQGKYYRSDITEALKHENNYKCYYFSGEKHREIAEQCKDKAMITNALEYYLAFSRKI